MNDAVVPSSRAASPRLNKKERLREQSVARLSQAAFGAFVSKGYHAATIDEIASVAELTKGAVYFYFESKENLLLHLLGIVEQNIVDALMAHLAGVHGGAGDRVVAFFHFGSQHGIERPNELLLLIQMSIEFKERDDAIARTIRRIYGRIYEALEGIVEAGKARGELARDLHTREVVSMIVAIHDGMMLEWHRRGGEIDGGGLVRCVRETLLHGILRAPDRAAV